MRDPATLARFLPLLEAPGFTAGHLEPIRESAVPGLWLFPHAAMDPVVEDLVQAAYADGWVMMNFDWVRWFETPEAAALRDDEAALARASRLRLAKLLTTVIRQDRFVEGALLAAFESGLMLRIIRRAAALAST
ncbi:DUF6508 domain-containing protein [Roseococcus sp. DSY-14]|uniref:DUF6508 domain-containing protein n=1 Tax=Roseococcus sp. DSY-14 TaxID=3369650 RepID=UPI00387B1B23